MNKQMKYAALIIVIFGLAGAAACSMALREALSRATPPALDLNGYQEVNSISTTGEGRFTASIDDEESAPHLRADLRRARGNDYDAVAHPLRPALRQRGHPCVPPGGADTPSCPPTEGTVAGVIDAADVIASVPDRGIEAGAFEELVHMPELDAARRSTMCSVRSPHRAAPGRATRRSPRLPTPPPPRGGAARPVMDTRVGSWPEVGLSYHRARPRPSASSSRREGPPAPRGAPGGCVGRPAAPPSRAPSRSREGGHAAGARRAPAGRRSAGPPAEGAASPRRAPGRRPRAPRGAR